MSSYAGREWTSNDEKSEIFACKLAHDRRHPAVGIDDDLGSRWIVSNPARPGDGTMPKQHRHETAATVRVSRDHSGLKILLSRLLLLFVRTAPQLS